MDLEQVKKELVKRGLFDKLKDYEFYDFKKEETSSNYLVYLKNSDGVCYKIYLTNLYKGSIPSFRNILDKKPVLLQRLQKINPLYHYHLEDLINVSTPIRISCNIHGIFKCSINNFEKGKSCPKCSKRFMNNDYFIEICNKKHLNKYSYNKCNYTKIKNNVTITCPVHGDFSIIAESHKLGRGCFLCNKKIRTYKKGIQINRKCNINTFVERANFIHFDKYDYSEFIYTNAKEKSKIICKRHGVFLQNANNHLSGQGCRKCSIEDTQFTHYNIDVAEKNKEEWSKIKSIVYFVTIYTKEEIFCKIGISKRDIKDRMYEIQKEKYEVINIFNTNLYNAINIETKLKRKFHKIKKIPKLKFGGMYECFSIKSKDEILKEFNKLIEEYGEI